MNVSSLEYGAGHAGVEARAHDHAHPSAQLVRRKGRPARRVQTVHWSEELRRDLTASAVVGPRGGSISLGDILTLSVPAGVLTTLTAITVRALAGQHAVLQLEPEGLEFVRAATLSVALRATGVERKTGWQRRLRLAYIESPAEIRSDNLVDAYESTVAEIDANGRVASFPVPHFSVVILASQVTRQSDDSLGRPQ